jgi:hypothetical protein
MKIHLADGITLRAKSITRIWAAMSADATREAPTAKADPGFDIDTAKLAATVDSAARQGHGAYVKQRGRLVRVVSVS